MSENSLETEILDSRFASLTEQEVRLEIVKKLLDKYSNVTRVEQEADRIVDYILNGKKEEPVPPKVIKKLPVFLPGQNTNEPTDAQVYIKDDYSMEIECFSRGQIEELWNLIDENRLVALSFAYYNDRPVDTSKDN